MYAKIVKYLKETLMLKEPVHWADPNEADHRKEPKIPSLFWKAEINEILLQVCLKLNFLGKESCAYKSKI